MLAPGAAADTDEASRARPPLTCCCAARFLAGQGPVPIRGPGVGDPCVGHNSYKQGHSLP